MTDTTSLLKLISKHFDVPENISEAHLREVLIKTFEYLVEDDFPKLLQVLYRADVDQYKLKDLLENTEGKSTAEIIADAYIERQKAKVETWKKYSSG
ncbi:hypothetical protein EZ428_15545 [Pedobacter frigiditerrae]|uniref:Uncharacterized protein n=1 Tax=Pedobacter frigiditerrae TaxID=2530452 RepID=A0A4R0MSZ8_9SPHI|nr:hypothetical protein [Pedobacter frigiditerrae]TCC89114.1 hypothetical protein EZ428_15545 [Pedobacter frigiditerrae]